VSNFNFKVKDYRIIKDADISPEGITLIYGKNGNGKSTIIKALVSLLSNKHSEDNFRHGKDTYSISARVGESSVTYKRSGSSAQVQYNTEPPKTKLGKGTLFEVEPRFPLKRIDYVDNYFFPNFSFQNSVPIFEDIDTASLFASMFSDMARISERVTACRNDCVNTAKVKNDSQVGSDMLKEKVLEASRQVDKIKADNPNLEASYTYLRGLAVKQANLAKFIAEFSELSAKCNDDKKRALVSLYGEAQPLFSDLAFVDGVRGVLAQLNKSTEELVSVQEEYKNLVGSFPVNVVSLVTGVKQINTHQSSLESIRKDVDALPVFSLGLVSGGFSLLKMNQTLDGIKISLQDILVVEDSLISEVQELFKLQHEYSLVSCNLNELNKEYDAVTQKLKEYPCQRLVDGLCPYQEQIKL